MLLRGGANPNLNAVDESGQTILHKRDDENKWAPLLVGHGADTRIKDNDGSEPVHYAALRDNRSMLATLRNGRASLDAQDRNDRTPLIIAASKGNPRLTIKLLNWGARCDLEDIYGRDAFYRACTAGDVLSAAQILGKGDGSQLNKSTHKGTTPLHTAAKNGHLDTVKWLLLYGADRNAKSTKPFRDSNVVGTPAEVARECRGGEPGHDAVADFIDQYEEDEEAPPPTWDVRLAPHLSLTLQISPD
jgi:ankyrin repeat protein